MSEKQKVSCSFCGRHQDASAFMVAGVGAVICSDCIGHCVVMLVAEHTRKDAEVKMIRGAKGKE